MQKLGFTVIELVFAFSFLAILASVVVFSINPLELAGRRSDEHLGKLAKQLARALEGFYVAEGRYPWSDDFASVSPAPPLPWTPAVSAEIGICADSGCSKAGELVEAELLAAEAIESSLWPKILVGKGGQPRDPVYACFVPLSGQERKRVGSLVRIKQGAFLPVSGVSEPCSSEVTWVGADVCYLCVVK